MMLSWLAAAALSQAIAAPPATIPPAPLAEARHAISVGRLEQARLMIGKAVAAGARGPAVDRLLADLAFETGRMDEAASGYAALAAAGSTEVLVFERAGLAALNRGRNADAAAWLGKASTMPGASWRVWNGLGVLADHGQDFGAADAAYAKAIALAPDEAQLINNIGWSMMLRGDWDRAAAELAKAYALDPSSKRIANNLELARAAIAEDLPRRRQGESDEDWSARLNDAGVIARARGDKPRAIAAFSRAIEARTIWYERAANNLELTQASNP